MAGRRLDRELGRLGRDPHGVAGTGFPVPPVDEGERRPGVAGQGIDHGTGRGEAHVGPFPSERGEKVQDGREVDAPECSRGLEPHGGKGRAAGVGGPPGGRHNFPDPAEVRVNGTKRTNDTPIPGRS